MRSACPSLLLVVVVLSWSACAQTDIDGARADDKAAQAVIDARSGRLEDALRGFEEALAIDPANLRSLYNGGLAALELGRGDEARAHFEGFVALRPGDALGHLHHARALIAAAEMDEAMGAVLRAVDSGLDDPEALSSPEFAKLQGELRFVQALALVGLRSGIRPTDDRGRLLVGGLPVKAIALPGTTSAVACEADVGAPLPE